MALFDQIFDHSLPDDPVAGLLSEPTPLLNTVVVPDRRLAALDRAADRPLHVTVINGTGAGGITALARRPPTTCRLAAVQTAVRDPGDPISNIARIAAAARELDPDVAVLVDIPDGFGWQDAVEAAEAEGLTAVASPAAPDRTAARLSGYIEADLPFVVDGIDSAATLVGLLAAVDRLIDQADVDAAEALMAGADADQHANAIRSWDDNRTGRVRPRLRAVRTTDLPRMLTELTAAGLIDF